ncbi:cystathionine beta-lyase [Varunaivibrio sulfuroxidans]|uniref:Cystathionine beta-lyase n=1 Tax=Varunaivibrio sulfuroxidans TaxID=1773489 RepID=A0A4R3JH44_9PROT|nr:cystathionine beta-lyase [Varunaivibrio sulfuroxidans]TCS64100.1 cystathionine beta-lyase [Varunaivibrio sulfuroxidans]WES31451.1 cystathionine beta-lyase [Varunaivibrio sulfuroxidans]
MKKDTLLATTARRPGTNFGIVNPPVYHASTVVFPTLKALHDAGQTPFEGVYYGRYGTPTTFAFEEAVATLEGGEKCIALPSGMAAIACAIMAHVQSGDHILMTDNAYYPTIKLCQGLLKGFGVETTYYDPMIGAGIAELMRPNTKIVFTEAPGSITFEVQDVPAIAEAAHRGGALVVMDNTWSAGYFFAPFEHGVDLSIQAATKYIGGHSDAMLGTITMAEKHYEHMRRTAAGLGYCAAPDDCYLGLRGVRSLAARLARHQDGALRIAKWLSTRPEVEAVLHPAFPSCPGHDTWKRDFTGASGLFGVQLKDYPINAIAAMTDGMEHFAMGYSWGGFESLIVPSAPAPMRTAYRWPWPGQALRLHIGLEDPDDLITDLERGFARLNAAL